MNEEGRASFLSTQDTPGYPVTYAFDDEGADIDFESRESAMRHAFEIHYLNHQEQ